MINYSKIVLGRKAAMASVVALALAAGTSARAAITLTFEGLQNNEEILNYYNGGFGGNGSGPGPNYGITFGSDSLALIASSAGGTGNFSGQPSGVTTMYFLGGPGDVMNVAAGFNTGFSFYYADQVGFTGSVSVWSGLNGTGTELTSLSLPSTPDPYNVFVPIGVAFAGNAESAIFSGSANFIGFDNITLGSATPGSGNGNGVPDGASTMALLSSGLLALGAIRRKLS
jgi:VPDSG-CTERM motif